METQPAMTQPSLYRRAWRFSTPGLATLAFLALLITWVIASAGGDPLALARLGTRYSQGNPHGTAGYDGQFVYFIARDLRPAAVAPLLDTPAYRYQRILLPLLARLISGGSLTLLPWALALVGLLSQAAGATLVGELLAGWGINRWYALTYGLWAGFALAVRLDLPEPLAYALVAAALLAVDRGRKHLGWIFYGLALFAKEVTIVFAAAELAACLLGRRWRDAAGILSLAILPFALFQGWLWLVFGQPGINSGGAMATPFEIIPFMGLFRIGSYSLPYLAAMLVVFGPAIVLPAVWGAWAAGRRLISGQINVVVLGLLFNALTIAFLPFSTFRETGGLLRFGCGFVFAVLLFAARYRLNRALNYSLLWIVLNVFLIKDLF